MEMIRKYEDEKEVNHQNKRDANIDWDTEELDCNIDEEEEEFHNQSRSKNHF